MVRITTVPSSTESRARIKVDIVRRPPRRPHALVGGPILAQVRRARVDEPRSATPSARPRRLEGLAVSLALLGAIVLAGRGGWPAPRRQSQRSCTLLGGFDPGERS